MQNANYVFIALDYNTVVLHINNTHVVECYTVTDIVNAFKQYNITANDTIMHSSDVEFASEYDFANDSTVELMLQEVYEQFDVVF